jgi:hypothetical protein
VASRKSFGLYPREIAGIALAHVIGDKAEQACRRSDALEKRRKLNGDDRERSAC